MSEGWTLGASFRKVFHKGVGEPVLAGLLYHFTLLKSHHPPRIWTKSYSLVENWEGEFGNKTKEKEIFFKQQEDNSYRFFRNLTENVALQINIL